MSNESLDVPVIVQAAIERQESLVEDLDRKRGYLLGQMRAGVGDIESSNYRLAATTLKMDGCKRLREQLASEFNLPPKFELVRRSLQRK